jgi:hypothetical protein
MAPPQTSPLEGYLEHPAEAFAEFAAAGVTEVVCEEKHMGSRAVAVLARTPEAAAARFGVTGEAARAAGVVYTRTGRPFFDDPALAGALAARLRAAVTRAGLWDELRTDWLVLDCELLPWSAKAGGLIREQYASVGAAARTVLPEAIAVLDAAAGRGLDVGGLHNRTRRRPGREPPGAVPDPGVRGPGPGGGRAAFLAPGGAVAARVRGRRAGRRGRRSRGAHQACLRLARL